MKEQLAACYRAFKTATSSLQSPLLLLVRLYWGWQFAQTGWGKLHNIPGVTNYFTQLGLPLPHLTVIFIALLEFGGGILILIFGPGASHSMRSLQSLGRAMTTQLGIEERHVESGYRNLGE